MEASAAARKRPVNLTLNEQLVAQAKALTRNLSATVELLLADFVAGEHNQRRSQQEAAKAACSDWNELHARMGSFADEHSTL